MVKRTTTSTKEAEAKKAKEAEAKEAKAAKAAEAKKAKEAKAKKAKLKQAARSSKADRIVAALRVALQGVGTEKCAAAEKAVREAMAGR